MFKREEGIIPLTFEEGAINLNKREGLIDFTLIVEEKLLMCKLDVFLIDNLFEELKIAKVKLLHRDENGEAN